MSDRADFAVAAQGAAPLTPLQVRVLAVEARRAYMAQRKIGLADDDFDTWRHAAVEDAAPGRGGLRGLTQGDFAAVRDWLRELSGGPAALPGRLARESDDARRARWALRRAADRCRGNFPGDVDAYVDSLFEKIHGTTRERASARQVWQVIFTLRARIGAKGRPRRASGTHPGKAAERATRRGAAENGQSAVRGAPRVFP